MTTTSIIVLSGVLVALYPAWRFIDDPVEGEENLVDKVLLTLLFSLASWLTVAICIISYFEKIKETEKVFQIRFSEAREMEREFRELRFMIDEGMCVTEAFHRSVKTMKLLYGDFWFALFAYDSEISDHMKAEEIQHKMDMYIYEQYLKENGNSLNPPAVIS